MILFGQFWNALRTSPSFCSFI